MGRLHAERTLGLVEDEVDLLWIEQVSAHSAHQSLGLLPASADFLGATEFTHEREQRDRAQVEYSRKLWPESGEHAFEPVAVLLERRPASLRRFP